MNTHDTRSAAYLKDIEMLNAEAAVIKRSTKTQILNNIESKLVELQTIVSDWETPDEDILTAITTNLDILEDARQIDMYKFQFKAFTSILRVEIKNIEDVIYLT